MNKNNIWDITPLVTASFPLWPGSEPLQRSVACDIDLGDPVTSLNITSYSISLLRSAFFPGKENLKKRRHVYDQPNPKGIAETIVQTEVN